jgi:hypothetical protein
LTFSSGSEEEESRLGSAGVFVPVPRGVLDTPLILLARARDVRLVCAGEFLGEEKRQDGG